MKVLESQEQEAVVDWAREPEKRAAMEISVIRDSMDSLGATARWVPHELNVSDCLTKRKGNFFS